MKVKPIMQEMLDSYFLSRGFHKAGSVFVRVKGEILQGAASRFDGGMYFLTTSCVPLLALSECIHDAKELKKGIWTEVYEMAGGYRYNQDETTVREGISLLLTQFDRLLMSRLDETDTLEKCLAFTYSGEVETLPSPLGFSYQIVQPMSVPLLLKAYRDGSFDGADGIIREWYRKREERRYAAFCEDKRYHEENRSIWEAELEEWKQYLKQHPDDYMAEFEMQAAQGALEEPTFIPGPKYEEDRLRDFPLFFEKKEAGDLDWISQQLPEYEAFANKVII